MASITTQLPRLFAFAREHQEQARTAGDEVRAWKWGVILDLLLDRRTFQSYMGRR